MRTAGRPPAQPASRITLPASAQTRGLLDPIGQLLAGHLLHVPSLIPPRNLHRR
ncbi:MAG: hypothetical protein ABI720_07935 [Actinomycetes bacterium]